VITSTVIGLPARLPEAEALEDDELVLGPLALDELLLLHADRAVTVATAATALNDNVKRLFNGLPSGEHPGHHGALGELGWSSN
jgi:hypothetical protein